MSTQVAEKILVEDFTIIATGEIVNSIDQIKLGALRRAIPSSCFQSSMNISLLYAGRDITYAVSLVYLALYIPTLPTLPLRMLAWSLYSFVQGCVGTGIWILAHECGHGSFSSSKGLNDLMGWVLHSILLVPYFSWKYTHARHHRYTGHIEKDVVFVPEIKQNISNKARLVALLRHTEETPVLTLLRLIRHQLFGWQMYLFFNVTAGEKSLPDGKKRKRIGVQSHFAVLGQLFSPSQRLGVLLSDAGLCLTLGVLYLVVNRYGWVLMLLLYLTPYLWVHHWLAITFLHHTHPLVPYHTAETWTFTKGALSTIDRSCGFLGRHFFHDIIDHHVVHHLFPKIPFYHAEEATRAIRPLLGPYYHDAKHKWFMRELFETFRSCNVVTESVEDKTGHPQPLYWSK